MQNFRNLLVWQKAYALANRIETTAEKFAPRKPSLARQLIDAAASIPAVICEGAGRATPADFAHFLTMAISSANEVENHLQRAFDRGLISPSQHSRLTADTIEVRKMLIGLRKRVLGKQ